MVIIWAAISDLASATDFTGQVVSASDGNTITVLHNGEAGKIRLNRIDCSELHQPFGTKAKPLTSSLAFRKEVTVQAKNTDKYGRTVADVRFSDERISTGNLWDGLVVSEICTGGCHTIMAGSRNKGVRLELWIDPAPIPPWEWQK